MVQLHGKGTVVLYNGFNLSGDFNQFDRAESVDSAASATFNSTSHEFIAGQLNGTFSWNFIYSDATPNVEASVIQADIASATPKSLMVLYRNVVLTRVACAKNALITAYNIGSTISDVVKGNGTFQSSGGLGTGVLLHALAAETTTPGTGTADSQIFGSATISALSLHATAPTITTAAPHGFRVGDVITITGSNSTPTLNNSSFTIVTVPTSTTFTIASTTTVAGTAGTVERITNNGGRFFVQATAVSGTTPSVVVNVKDSADGVTYATIATITITVAGAQEVDIVGNIRKFTRCEWTITGSAGPGATFASALQRINLN